ncbi:MAG: type II toxin-antitoxin system VapB family antitoxin [Proteobacteria bacterium]|nr:type II toxin-antitoxin system VapB family antitoxin [Pseudomonadota bacterium]
MMRTNVDIDDKLMEEAFRLTDAKTKKELLNLSLKKLILEKRKEHLIGLYGTSPVDITLEDIERAREDE